eukprot:TRINITY_DN66224_c9_g6_i1.p1 TRINITY_DN66224_c9_g6~~TRINITY_DN66224_c9_g6_i1.p1  ORF type:complete len:1127 (+),score=83.36 TRINITY_DN66224_c9_g6_i1:80-3460(+)
MSGKSPYDPNAPLPHINGIVRAGVPNGGSTNSSVDQLPPVENTALISRSHPYEPYPPTSLAERPLPQRAVLVDSNTTASTQPAYLPSNPYYEYSVPHPPPFEYHRANRQYQATHNPPQETKPSYEQLTSGPSSTNIPQYVPSEKYDYMHARSSSDDAQAPKSQAPATAKDMVKDLVDTYDKLNAESRISPHERSQSPVPAKARDNWRAGVANEDQGMFLRSLGYLESGRQVPQDIRQQEMEAQRKLFDWKPLRDLEEETAISPRDGSEETGKKSSPLRLSSEWMKTPATVEMREFNRRQRLENLEQTEFTMLEIQYGRLQEMILHDQIRIAKQAREMKEAEAAAPPPPVAPRAPLSSAPPPRPVRNSITRKSLPPPETPTPPATPPKIPTPPPLPPPPSGPTPLDVLQDELEPKGRAVIEDMEETQREALEYNAERSKNAAKQGQGIREIYDAAMRELANSEEPIQRLRLEEEERKEREKLAEQESRDKIFTQVSSNLVGRERADREQIEQAEREARKGLKEDEARWRSAVQGQAAKNFFVNALRNEEDDETKDRKRIRDAEKAQRRALEYNEAELRAMKLQEASDRFRRLRQDIQSQEDHVRRRIELEEADERADITRERDLGVQGVLEAILRREHALADCEDEENIQRQLLMAQETRERYQLLNRELMDKDRAAGAQKARLEALRILQQAEEPLAREQIEMQEEHQFTNLMASLYSSLDDARRKKLELEIAIDNCLSDEDRRRREILEEEHQERLGFTQAWFMLVETIDILRSKLPHKLQRLYNQQGEQRDGIEQDELLQRRRLQYALLVNLQYSDNVNNLLAWEEVYRDRLLYQEDRELFRVGVIMYEDEQRSLLKREENEEWQTLEERMNKRLAAYAPRIVSELEQMEAAVRYYIVNQAFGERVKLYKTHQAIQAQFQTQQLIAQREWAAVKIQSFWRMILAWKRVAWVRHVLAMHKVHEGAVWDKLNHDCALGLGPMPTTPHPLPTNLPVPNPIHKVQYPQWAPQEAMPPYYPASHHRPADSITSMPVPPHPSAHLQQHPMPLHQPPPHMPQTETARSPFGVPRPPRDQPPPYANFRNHYAPPKPVASAPGPPPPPPGAIPMFVPPNVADPSRLSASWTSV